MNRNLLDSLLTKLHRLADHEVIQEPEHQLDRHHVKLLTYNLFLRPPPAKNNASDHKEDRLEHFIKMLDEYDIVCLQECFMWLNSRKQKLSVYATKQGFNLQMPTAPSIFSRGFIDSGLVIMSRFPIVEQDELIFSKYYDVDAFTMKGSMYAKIEIDGKHLHLFNTHTQANYYDSSFKAFQSSVNFKLT